jgi:hypothetical protein
MGIEQNEKKWHKNRTQYNENRIKLNFWNGNRIEQNENRMAIEQNENRMRTEWQ